jgi:5-hydroxyisourate hydrolase
MRADSGLYATLQEFALAAAGISVHVVDVSRGVVAQGMKVLVERLEAGHRVLLADAAVGAGGSVHGLDAIASAFTPGIYEVTFFVGDFYRALGVSLPPLPFLDVVPYRFGLADASQHYHLPFKVTPWGFSCFRGGA